MLGGWPSMTVDAYPLQWPEGWKRHNRNYRDNDNRFRGSVYGELSIGRTRDQLLHELKLLGAADVVISSNLRLRNDGLPLSNQPRMLDDPGVAVYFKLNKRPMVMARDQYQSVAGNLRSLTLAVDAMRQLERHGGSGMMERAFTGFVAIAPPDWKKPWREVFGVKPDWSGDITALYREKARNRHPDAEGSNTLMAELNVAYDEAKQELGEHAA
jgi:hypothetical protein